MLATDYNYLDSSDEIRHITMFKDFILCRRCHAIQSKYLVGKVSEEESAEARLYIETLTNKSNWMEVLAIGKNVKENRLHVGYFVLVPENYNEPVMWRGVLKDPNLYIFKEKALLAFTK